RDAGVERTPQDEAGSQAGITTPRRRTGRIPPATPTVQPSTRAVQPSTPTVEPPPPAVQPSTHPFTRSRRAFPRQPPTISRERAQKKTPPPPLSLRALRSPSVFSLRSAFRFAD